MKISNRIANCGLIRMHNVVIDKTTFQSLLRIASIQKYSAGYKTIALLPRSIVDNIGAEPKVIMSTVYNLVPRNFILKIEWAAGIEMAATRRVK